MNAVQAIVLMGVSGSGKTSVGIALSKKLTWPFFDGDDFHPESNIAKMADGKPLDDEDRASWLALLHDLIREHLMEGKSLILACSALKEKYRSQLAMGNKGTVFVHLRGDFNLIYSRMQARAGHYMKVEMLASQFSILEAPKDAIIIEIDQTIEAITKEILDQLHLSY